MVDIQDDELPPENEPMNKEELGVVNDNTIVSEEEDHEEETHANENDDAPTVVAESDPPVVVAELDDRVERERVTRGQEGKMLEQE